MNEAQPISPPESPAGPTKIAAMLASFAMLAAAVAIVALAVPWAGSPPSPRKDVTVIDVPEGTGPPPPRSRLKESNEDMTSLDRSAQ